MGLTIRCFKGRLKSFVRGITFVMHIGAPVAAHADRFDLVPWHSSFELKALAKPGQVQLERDVPLELLGKNQVQSDDMSPLTHWSSLLKRFEASLHATAPPSVIADWRAEIKNLKGLPPHEQIMRVNDFMNSVPYVDDQQRYGVEGYWRATPERFFSSGGDCKDYALMKYTSLRALGFTPEQLRIAVVTDITKNVRHAILIVTEAGASYVLDNQVHAIKAAAEVHRYRPIFAVNSRSWWKYTVSDES